MATSIYINTRLAAIYFGVTPQVLYANYQRKGHYENVKPLKSSKGRLSWPSQQVSDAAPPCMKGHPDGTQQFIELIATAAPGISERDRYTLADYFLGSEAFQGWKPAASQTAKSIASDEFAMSLMLFQASLDRIEWAQSNGASNPPKRALEFAAALHNRLGYLVTPVTVNDAGCDHV